MLASWLLHYSDQWTDISDENDQAFHFDTPIFIWLFSERSCNIVNFFLLCRDLNLKIQRLNFLPEACCLVSVCVSQRLPEAEYQNGLLALSISSVPVLVHTFSSRTVLLDVYRVFVMRAVVVRWAKWLEEPEGKKGLRRGWAAAAMPTPARRNPAPPRGAGLSCRVGCKTKSIHLSLHFICCDCIHVCVVPPRLGFFPGRDARLTTYHFHHQHPTPSPLPISFFSLPSCLSVTPVWTSR